MSILRQSPAFAKTVVATSVATLVEVIPSEVVTLAIERSPTRGKRRRKLPAELMAIAIVVLGLFAGGTLCDAVRKTLLKRPALHGHQLKTTPFIETVRIC